MNDERWKFPDLTPIQLFKWGTVVFVLVVYVLIITMIVSALFGVFP